MTMTAQEMLHHQVRYAIKTSQGHNDADGLEADLLAVIRPVNIGYLVRTFRDEFGGVGVYLGTTDRKLRASTDWLPEDGHFTDLDSLTEAVVIEVLHL